MYTVYTFQMSSVRQWIKWFILLCVDTWITCSNRYKSWQIRRAQAQATDQMLKLPAVQLVAATTDRNVTPILHAFYAHNELVSCYRLQSHMRVCGVVTTAVVIYTMRDCVMRKSVVDLENNLELLTRSDIDDVAIETLPSVVLTEITNQQ